MSQASPSNETPSNETPSAVTSILAVVPVRGGVLPLGALEVVAEAAGSVLLVGEDAASAALELAGLAARVEVWDTPGFAPGRWARALTSRLAAVHRILLPASPDGRDLAPRIAAALERPLHAGAMQLDDHRVVTVRHGGRVLAHQPVGGAAVITFQPGVRNVERDGDAPPTVVELELPTESDAPADRDATVVEVLPPDVTTMDLSEAPRILGGGAGLESAERFAQLNEVAATLGASMGATRVITDRGWISHDRQIGTTGVVVDPRLYLAFGISGAVQHTAGLGQPDHTISINTDPHCPMMELADLAVVADANATLDELADRLGVQRP